MLCLIPANKSPAAYLRLVLLLPKEVDLMSDIRTKIAAVLLGMATAASSPALADGGATKGAAGKAVSREPNRPRALIFLWMQGGVSHLDTFDMKPDAPVEIRGPFKSIQTSVPGLHISEHLPRIARVADQLVVIRSLTHRESDHGRASILMNTGRMPIGVVDYPSLPAALAKELSNDQSLLPFFVSFAGRPVVGEGYLESKYAPLLITDDMLKRSAKAAVQPNKVPCKSEKEISELLRQLTDRGLATRERARLQLEELGMSALPSLRKALAEKPDLETFKRIDRLIDRIKSERFADALNLEREPLALRESYGRDRFGQGCLAARRLVEHGVPVVQVNMGGWDTHVQSFRTLQQRSGVLDAALAALLSDLKERGLLDTTLIVWVGEFGRTPRINGQAGRDHWPQAFSVVLAGAGIKGGQVIGKTDRSGAQVAERPVSVPELMATICTALSVDPTRRRPTDRGVMIPLVDDNSPPVKEAFREKAAK